MDESDTEIGANGRLPGMPTVTLTSRGMTEPSFDAWCEFVAAHIDARAGFEVDVMSFRFGSAARDDAIDGATDEQEEAIRAAVSGLRDEFLALPRPA